MALLHQAELTPSKLDLLNDWVYDQEWFTGDTDEALSNVASYRFDDPEGEVGVETILIRAGDGPILQVPLTYRSAPLGGAESALIGTMEHSVLGKRWVYDGVSDPVYIQTATSAAINGGHQAALFIDIEGERVERTPNCLVAGTGTGSTEVGLPAVDGIVIRQEGSVTIMVAGPLHLRLQRVIGAGDPGGSNVAADQSLSAGWLEGTWKNSEQPQRLLFASLD